MESTDIERNDKESADVVQLVRETEKEMPEGLQNIMPCGLDSPHGEHSWRVPGRSDGALDQGEPFATCEGVAAPVVEDLGTYAGMFAEYLHEQRHWIGPAQQPLVFHVRKLCQKLDADPNASASYASAYLQAISRLDKQRPGNTQPAGAAGDLPGQASIFDELD